MAAIMYGHPAGRSEPFTAADWTDPDQPDVTAYVKSKYLAERHAWQIMEEAGRRNDLAVINPSNVQGPLLDDDPGTSGALTIRLMDGGLPAVPQMSFPTIDVRDVAAAHVAALQNPGAGGHRFPMSAGTIAFIDAANALRRAFPEQARKIPRSVVPNVLVRFFAMFDRDLRDNVGELGRLKIVDSTLAMKLLGHDLIPPDDAFVAMGGSLIERGLV
jgi:dihydroflavonol-4-reductase